jgi:hypothetical protein
MNGRQLQETMQGHGYRLGTIQKQKKSTERNDAMVHRHSMLQHAIAAA